MTSPSPKKRRTTPRSTPAANRTSDLGLQFAQCGSQFDHTVADEIIRIPQAELRHSSTWLPAALLATLVLLASTLQAFGGETQQLQWRAARTAHKIQPQATTTARSRAVRRVANDHRDYAVMQVVYDQYDSPRLTPQGEARLESVVVHPRDPQFEGTGPSYRTAQDPFEDDAIDSELNRDITIPFGQPTEPMPELGVDELPDPIEPDVPDPIDNELDFGNSSDNTEPDDQPTLQPGGRTPSTFPGSRQPTSQPEAPRRAEVSNPRAQAKFEEEEQKALSRCEQEIAEAREDTIYDIDLSIRLEGKQGLDYPFECSVDDGKVFAGRHWPEVTYMWKAAANCHKPLYFEQRQLERYGHSWGPCVQPLVSGAHFFTRFPVLPYCMGLTPPNECLYPLGHYRPGNCAPYMIDPVPFTWRAAMFEAGGAVGTAFFLP